MADYYSDPNLKSAYGDYEKAAGSLVEYQSASSLLPQKLKDAINEKIDYDKGLIEEKNKAMGEYFQAPSEARAKYADPESEDYIFNPFQAENLVARERSMAYQPYANMVDIMNTRRGSLADVINAGTGAFNSMVTAQQGNVGLLRQKYEDLLDLAKLRTDAAGSGGFSLEDMINAVSKLQPDGEPAGDNVSAPTEPKPTTSEHQIQRMKDSPNVMWRSPGGQWEYNFEYNDWVPVGATVIE